MPNCLNVYHDSPLQLETSWRNSPSRPKWSIQQKTTLTPPMTPPTTYERHITHAAEIKFINDRYITSVTVEFGSSKSDNSVNFSVKHRKLFTVLTLLDPSLSITINDTTFNHPGEFSTGITYTEFFDVIVDKKLRYLCFFVHHDIHSKIKLTTLKFDNHNIMSTLQSLSTWLNLNHFSTHREASIGFIKYVTTGLTLHHIAKKRVSTALMNIDLFLKILLHFKELLREMWFTIITTNVNQMDN